MTYIITRQMMTQYTYRLSNLQHKLWQRLVVYQSFGDSAHKINIVNEFYIHCAIIKA